MRQVLPTHKLSEGASHEAAMQQVVQGVASQGYAALLFYLLHLKGLQWTQEKSV